MVHGELNRKIGKKLTKCISNNCEVFYDQGDSTDEHAAHIKAVIGKELRRSTQVCQIDIVIVKDNEVLALIEIEEKSFDPTLLGDLLSIALDDSIFIKNKRYEITGTTQLLIIGHGKGDRKLKQISKIRDQLNSKYKDLIQNTKIDSFSEFSELENKIMSFVENLEM
jgi:hypothetical protein